MESAMGALHSAAALADRAGYPKSERTRLAILSAALNVFAQHGFAAASTREIAQSARVALPAIAYHFGNKEGLFLACADAVVAGHRAALAPLIAMAEQLLEKPEADAQACRDMIEKLLKAVLRSFLDPVEGRARADFAVRALRGPEAGLALLRDHVWAPGVTLIASLVAAARRSACTVSERSDALALISGLLAYPLGHAVTADILGTQADLSKILEVLDGTINRQVAAIR